MKKLCYFGIYKPTAPRDRIYLEELKKKGVEIVECIADESFGLVKLFYAARKLWVLKDDYDFIFVGYLSAVLVPLARMISRKKIVFNALNPLYESYVLDRWMHAPFSLWAIFIWIEDFLSFHASHLVLVESFSQKEFISKVYHVKLQKLKEIFTGVEESVFHPDPKIEKGNIFTVAFRGMFIPATGVEYIMEAARILKTENIKFLMIGWGQLLDKVKDFIKKNKLDNIELVSEFQEPDALRRKLLSSHVLLGQFSTNKRLNRTIQHKNSEALALNMPFITRDSKSNRELLTDGFDCLFVRPASAEAIVDKIIALKNDENLRQRLSLGAKTTYEKKLAPNILGVEVFAIIQALL